MFVLDARLNCYHSLLGLCYLLVRECSVFECPNRKMLHTIYYKKPMFILKRRVGLQKVLLLSLAAILITSAGCRVQQQESGEVPEVDVDVEPGNLPEYEVEGPEVDVGTEKQKVTVPEVEVTQETKTIEVPDIDVEPPSADDGNN